MSLEGKESYKRIISRFAKTATMDAGYPVGRVRRPVNLEEGCAVLEFARSWPSAPGIAVYSFLEGLLIHLTALLEVVAGHPVGLPPIETPCR
jgi:hypothetical protein